jgi:hypothetical protein
MMDCLLARQEEAAAQIAANHEATKFRQEEMKADINAEGKARQDKEDNPGGGPSGSVQRRHKRPHGDPSGRTEVLWEKDDSLPSTVSGLSREVEGRCRKKSRPKWIPSKRVRAKWRPRI